MASKTRKIDPANPSQPSTEIVIPAGYEPAAADHNDDDTYHESDRRIGKGKAALVEEDGDHEEPEPSPSEKLRDHYTKMYGHSPAELLMRHAVPRSKLVGQYLAEHRDELGADVAMDILAPVIIDGKPLPVEKIITLLHARDEAELAEGLTRDVKKFSDHRVARALIFSFAAHHIFLVAREEGDGEYPHAEAGAPMPEV